MPMNPNGYDYPVAIIGGGPVGLVSSILLSLHQIPHVLFERYPDTSIHPKACGLNQRTVEIFRKIGVEGEVLKQRAPPETVCRTAWYTSIGPSGREITSRPAWVGKEGAHQFASPSPYSILPQIRLEPILKKRALELNPDGIRYSCEVVDVDEELGRPLLRVKDDSDTFRSVRVRCVIGADGGRGLAEKLGVRWNGESDIVEMITAHIKAPISQHHPDPRVFLSWFINPALGGSIGTGYLYHLGPYPSTPETEEWVFACALGPDDPKNFTRDSVLERMNDTLCIPDLDADILSLSHWNVNAKTVESYRALQGRLFFVGDAAHRVPPWGALGLNSGIQDADNLIWKLALALKHPHKSYDRLLDTYDAERRPIGERVARTSLHNLQSHAGVMDAALGIAPTNSIEANTKAMAQYFDVTDKTGGARRRQAIAQALEIMDIEFDAHGAEVGWFYPSADLNNEGTATRHDGQLTKDGELDLCVYHPSTIPGHQLPHAWLERDSRRVSTRDLVHLAKLTLFAQSAQPWADLAHDLVHVEIIDPKIGWKDVDGAWRAQCGVGASGAIFVRPDGIVAYRVPDSASAAKANTSLNDVFAELVAILLKEAVPLSGERSVARYKL